ncbi:small ubiquitin-related modifier 2-like [Coffea eugenioides]|uniref:Small ubiquitin-related modifier 2-like n=1 Tax=Coffea arabica TaxID=13443 RepID=A0ABM4X9L9_COFAR|nr:small ubiquitin-related modifier 2-like [Coffea arabica]XP_027167089.1 small ubiquitin-related modifier 2-like [Coffea eugenioides]XP_027167090.1 small ubiquitin-related modifier 2-like [Coffea eugenioides]XP_027183490.1 small ubiquitin-related modifier 2-like [Coffea eugenioides]XP_027183491.1 small ubiquitin-related modifier 2-like [Coffea eugenioides]
MARRCSGRKRPLEMSYEPCDERVLLRMLGQDGKMMLFKVKRNKPLKTLLMKYCDYKKFDYSTVNFLHLGRRVLVRSTPEELGMRDGDIIEAMVHVDGGGDVKDIQKMWPA